MLPTLILVGLAFALAFGTLMIAATDGIDEARAGTGERAPVRVAAVRRRGRAGDRGRGQRRRHRRRAHADGLLDGYQAALLVPVAMAALGLAVTATRTRLRVRASAPAGTAVLVEAVDLAGHREPASAGASDAGLGPPPARALDLHLLREEVGADHEGRGRDLRADRLDRRVDAEPQPGPVRQLDVDRRDRHPARALHRAHGLADHHDEHEADEDAGDDQHLLVGQLALEVERDRADGERHRQAEAGALEHGRGAGAQLQRLQEEHGLEALAVDADVSPSTNRPIACALMKPCFSSFS